MVIQEMEELILKETLQLEHSNVHYLFALPLLLLEDEVDHYKL